MYFDGVQVSQSMTVLSECIHSLNFSMALYRGQTACKEHPTLLCSLQLVAVDTNLIGHAMVVPCEYLYSLIVFICHM